MKFLFLFVNPLVDLEGDVPGAHPLWNPILSFLHTFSPKSAHVRGPHPPNACMPPYGKSWIHHCEPIPDEAHITTCHHLPLTTTHHLPPLPPTVCGLQTCGDCEIMECGDCGMCEDCAYVECVEPKEYADMETS